MSMKRVNYFTHQFLREQDFKDEQAYHLEMSRRHHRMLHGWGVITGLEVQKKGEREITITPGTAIDKEGRELTLTEHVSRDLSSSERSSYTHVTIAYAETWDEADHQAAGGVEGYTRVTESPKIDAGKREPPKDGSVVTLARIQLDDVGHIHRIEMDASIRKPCGISNPAAGWIRLPFKPLRLNPVKVDGKRVRVVSESEAEEVEFVVDEATAYCDQRGARGSMQIPVPPSAKSIVGFRIAGTTAGNVTVHLFRTGWNLQDNKGEKTELLKETVHGPSFHKDIPVESRLDDSHALAVSVKAEGEAVIWLVAVKFE